MGGLYCVRVEEYQSTFKIFSRLSHTHAHSVYSGGAPRKKEIAIVRRLFCATRDSKRHVFIIVVMPNDFYVERVIDHSQIL